MTPLLVLGFNIQPAVAVGTDLLYAAITKSGGIWTHNKLNNIDWSIVKKLSLGSIPGSIGCIIFIKYIGITDDTFEEVITFTLGFMLILTSVAILFKETLSNQLRLKLHYTPSTMLIVTLGAVLGVLVTISSVGAGAVGGALLLMLYPRLSTRQIIGTDIAHAVPLTALGGLGHFQLGHIDFNLLISLLIGSLPAIYIGIMAGEKLPDKLLKYMLASILLIIGIKFAV